ncbi:hypothetical protein Tco_0506664 [Tanacetum coccineum]
MTTLKFADTHNMVAFLSKPAESNGFEQIVDFLNAHPIRYALTINPTIYISCIEQFWSTIMAKTINGEEQLHALVDGKKIIITESSIRRDLQLADEEDEAVYKVLGDCLVGLATTAYSLEAYQDSGEDASKQGRIDAINADEEITLCLLQAQEQEELSIEEKATLFLQLLEKIRKHFAAKRAEEKRNKPPTKAQQRKITYTYLKNIEGYKLNDLKLKEFDSIQEMYDRAFKRQKVEDDKETAELKHCLEIILDEEEDPYLMTVVIGGVSKGDLPILIRPGEAIPFDRPYSTHLNGPRKLLTARKRVGPLPARRLAWWRAPPRSSDYHPYSSSSSLDSSPVHSSGLDAHDQAHFDLRLEMYPPRFGLPSGKCTMT